MRSKLLTRSVTLSVLSAAAVVLVHSLACTPNARPDSPAGPRPRLYLDAARLPSLRASATGSHSGQWARVTSWVDDHLDQSPPETIEGDFRRVGEMIPYAALCRLVSGKPEYLELAKRYMLGVTRYEHWGDDVDIEAAHLLYGLAVGYDWLHGDLEEEERAAVRTKLTVQGRRMRRRGGLWHPPLNNHRVVNLGALGVAGLTLAGEVGEAKEWIDHVERSLTRTLAYYGTDGASCEGVSYWSYTTEYLLKYAVAAHELHGSTLLMHPWLRNAASWPQALALPRDAWARNNMFINFADSPRFCWYGPHYQLHKIAAIHRLPDVQWLADQVFASGFTRNHADWLGFLWYDSTLESRSPGVLPATTVFRDWDVAVMRSGALTNDTLCAFKCSPVGGHQHVHAIRRAYPGSGHCHPDANSFVIFAQGEWLAADAGATLLKRTANHNTLLVNGFGQRGEGARWFKGRAQHGRGGKARFVHSESRPGVDYFVGDASHVYERAAGLTRFLRHFIFLRPDMLLVVDELSAKTESEFMWLMHTPGRIVLPGHGRALVRNGRACLQLAVVSPDSAGLLSDTKAVETEYPDEDWNTLNVVKITPARPCRSVCIITAMLVGDPAVRALQVETVETKDALHLTLSAGTTRRKLVLTRPGQPRPQPQLLRSVR